MPYTRERTNPVLVPPLQDVPEFKPRVSARGWMGGRFSVPRLGFAETRDGRTSI